MIEMLQNLNGSNAYLLDKLENLFMYSSVLCSL